MPPSGGTRTSLTYQFGPMSGLAQFGEGGVLSPGRPLPAPDGGRPVRTFDFAVGQNRQWTPRAYEPFGFAELRAFANVELVRLAIETRKDQIERLGWIVRPKAGTSRPRTSDAETRIRRVEAFLRKPDGETPFATWLRMLLEDLLTLDAPAIERRRDRGGNLIGLDVVPGDTILLLVDESGRRPKPPAPAYQQVIKGRVWADNLTTEDLIYAPRNRRPHRLYGFSPVEQVIVTLNIALRRQASQLSHFSDGNIPAGLINVPEGWSADQIREFQEWMDARLAGNTAERSKLLWGPAGSKYVAFKDAPLKDEYDEWLARVVCFAFSLPPTPFVRQMNRGTAQEDDKRAMEEGAQPLLLWAKRLLDDVIQSDLGHPDLEFAWDVAPEVSPKVQAEIDDTDLRNASTTINEVRQRRGQDPIPGGDKPMIYTTAGAVPLEAVLAQAEATRAAAEATVRNGGVPPIAQDPNKPEPGKKATGDEE